MIEMHETTVAKPAQSSKAAPAPPAEHLKIAGRAQLMRIYIGESDRWRDKPLHQALVEAMRANDIAGVTVYRGIFGLRRSPARAQRQKPMHLSHDSSIMLSLIDSADKLESFLPIVEQMVAEGLVVLSDVDIIKYAYRAADQER